MNDVSCGGRVKGVRFADEQVETRLGHFVEVLERFDGPPVNFGEKLTSTNLRDLIDFDQLDIRSYRHKMRLKEGYNNSCRNKHFPFPKMDGTRKCCFFRNNRSLNSMT